MLPVRGRCVPCLPFALLPGPNFQFWIFFALTCYTVHWLQRCRFPSTDSWCNSAVVDWHQHGLQWGWEVTSAERQAEPACCIQAAPGKSKGWDQSEHLELQPLGPHGIVAYSHMKQQRLKLGSSVHPQDTFLFYNKIESTAEGVGFVWLDHSELMPQEAFCFVCLPTYA